MKTHTQTVDRLAASYTKALLQNPKAKIWENMERAVIENAHIVKCVNAHTALVEIAEQAHAAFSYLSAKASTRADKDEFAARALNAWNTVQEIKTAKGE